MIKDNYIEIENNITTLCNKNNLSRENVTLIAVSKTKPGEDIEQVYEVGCRDFGENKAQELVAKYDVLPKDIRWHFIGTLQKNNGIKYRSEKYKA